MNLDIAHVLVLASLTMLVLSLFDLICFAFYLLL